MPIKSTSTYYLVLRDTCVTCTLIKKMDDPPNTYKNNK